MELGSSGGVLGQVAPAGVPLAVSPAGAGLRRITYISLAGGGGFASTIVMLSYLRLDLRLVDSVAVY
jgi:hypothetical protein